MPDDYPDPYLDPSEYSYDDGQNLPSTPIPGMNDYGYGTNGLPNPGSMPGGASSLSPGGGSDGGGGGGAFPGGIPGAAVTGFGNFLTTLFGAKERAKQAALARQAAADAQTRNLASSTAQSTQNLAEREAARDPFSHRMSQMRDVAKLDRVQNADTTPTRLTASGPYASYVPQISGGYSYQRSPELRGAAGAAKTSIMSGTPDPTMTNPSNYGKTGALDLINIASGNKDPSKSSSFATGAPAPASTLGADPVANAVRQGYQQQLGRTPSDAEIQTTIGNLSRALGRQVTAADSAIITQWILKDLANSPEAMGRRGGPSGQPALPSYMSNSVGGGGGGGQTPVDPGNPMTNLP